MCFVLKKYISIYKNSVGGITLGNEKNNYGIKVSSDININGKVTTVAGMAGLDATGTAVALNAKDIVISNHNISITQRKNINISGVKKIDNFDENEFLLETNLGYLSIKGSNLEIIKLDTYQGDVSIKGKIDCLNYIESANKKQKNESIFSKLFK